MNICKHWSFNVIIFSLLSYGICSNIDKILDSSESKDQRQYVNPHSFYYDKNSKTEVKTTKQQAAIGNDVIRFSPNDECNRIFDECVNKKGRSIPDDLFSYRIINAIMSVASFELIDDIHVGNVIIKLTSDELEKLNYYRKTKQNIRDIDNIIPNIFKAPEKKLFQDTITIISQLYMTLIINKYIIFGSFILIYMTWKIFTTKWSMLKLISVTIMIIFVSSFIISWLKFLEEAEIRLTVKQMQHSRMPNDCQPEKMTWWNKIWVVIFSEEKCSKYYEAMMENPFLQVTPAKALSHTLSIFIMHPVEIMGRALSDFAHHSTRKLPGIIQIVIEPLIIIGIIILFITIIIVIFFGSLFMKWNMPTLPSLSSLSGTRGGSSYNSLNNADERKPIQMIFNINQEPHHCRVHQPTIECVEENDIVNISSVNISSVKNETTRNESVADSSISSESLELVPHPSPASGDSNSQNTQSISKAKDSSKTKDSEVKKINVESGSGDN